MVSNARSDYSNEVMVVVYLFQYNQKNRDDVRYKRIGNYLQQVSYYHEIERGQWLVAPVQCHIYNLRTQLETLLAQEDRLLITPVLINTFEDAVSHGFVHFWIDTLEPEESLSADELMDHMDR